MTVTDAKSIREPFYRNNHFFKRVVGEPLLLTFHPRTEDTKQSTSDRVSPRNKLHPHRRCLRLPPKYLIQSLTTHHHVTMTRRNGVPHDNDGTPQRV